MPNTYRLETLIPWGDPAIRVMTAYHTTNERHDHDFYELVYVKEGFCLHDTDGSVTLLMEGDIFILKPWVSHKYIGNRETFIYNCIFGEQAIRQTSEQLMQLPGLDRLFSSDTKQIVPRLRLTLNERKSFLRIIEWMYEDCEKRPPGWILHLRCLLNCLLVAFSRAYQIRPGTGDEKGAFSAYVAQALNLIDAMYPDPNLKVSAIAEMAGVSGDYLSRQFHQVMGISAQEYLQRYRFARAMELLQANTPVTEVARQVGFGSLSSFSRAFKTEMGVTPSHYQHDRTE